ncbi:PDZ and LIM domain protein Zasp, partial [Trichostrongylus colubriformis]
MSFGNALCVVSESRVPASVRSAVSPRRATKSPRQWPPEHGLPTLRYWQIDPASQSRKEKENEPASLHDLVEATDREKENDPKRGRARKNVTPSAQVVFSKVFEHNSEQQEASVTVENTVTHAAASSTLPSTKPTINNGIRWTVIHAPSSPELRAQYPRNETPTIERPQNLTPSPELAAEGPKSDVSSEEAPQETNHTLQVQVTTDSSTSPIPTIELPRRRSATADHSGIIKALSPAPFKRTSPPIPPATPPLQKPLHPLEVDTLLPDHQYRSLVGVNTTPRPFSHQSCSPSPVPTVEEKPKRTKALKKVDFSKATVIPEIWHNTSEVIDEEETQCDLSPTSSLPFTPPPDKESSSNDTATPYDGDESETYDNKSDNASTIEIEDEQEQWMREEIELAQKEELAKMGSPMQIRTIPDHKELWRQQAMALLNDDTQMERDIAIVAALNDRLQGIKHMEEEDRQKAIACIERHQSNLEEAQDQLSALLDSAIAFLRKLDTSSSAASRASHREEVPPAPSPLKSYDVCDVLKGSEATSYRFKGPGDFIAERLDRICATNGQSYTRSTFEQHTEHHSTTGGGGGGAPAGKLVESRGHGSLNNPGNPGGRIPYCESCKQQIRGAFVLATGLAWCPEHFVCAYRGCGRRLLECGFVEESGSKYCEGCFEAHIAPRCAKCAKPIISDCLNAMQKKWHPTCFTCAHCHKPFGNTAFYLENGLAYCENDWNALFTTKCVSCKYPIEAGDRWVEALGNAFHSNC